MIRIFFNHILAKPTDTDLPDSLKPPSDNKFKFLLYTFGAQEFRCDTSVSPPVWKFIALINSVHVNDITKRQTFIPEDIVAEHPFTCKNKKKKCFITRYIERLANFSIDLILVDKGGSAIWKSKIPSDGSTCTIINFTSPDIVSRFKSPDGSENMDWFTGKVGVSMN
jgi:hypothetical protein